MGHFARLRTALHGSADQRDGPGPSNRKGEPLESQLDHIWPCGMGPFVLFVCATLQEIPLVERQHGVNHSGHSKRAKSILLWRI